MADPIRAAMVRTLYLQVRNQTPATIVVTLYMVGTAWPFTPWPRVVGWAVAVLGVATVRALLARAFARAAPSDAEIPTWAHGSPCGGLPCFQVGKHCAPNLSLMAH